MTDRVDVGPFELIPRRLFEDGDTQHIWVAEAVRGLFDLYKVRTTSLGHGVVVRPRRRPFKMAADLLNVGRDALPPSHWIATEDLRL